MNDDLDEERESWHEFDEPEEPLESAERRLDDPRRGQAAQLNRRIE